MHVTKNDDNDLREKTAKLWAEMNNAPITAEMINCMGCRAKGVKTPFCDNMCEIRKCTIIKKMNTCGDCKNMENYKTVSMITGNNKEAKENLIKK